MVWVIRVNFRELIEREVEAILASANSLSAQSGTSTASFNHFRAISIEVLQASGGAQAKLWSEEGKQPGSDGKRKEKEGDLDPFIAALPKDLCLEDCIIDKKAHKTVDEQRAFYGKKMRELAREKKGWELYATTEKTSRFKQQLDVYRRPVPWSSANQLRSAVKTDLDLAFLYRYICEGMTRETTSADVDKYANGQGSIRRAIGYHHYVFSQEDNNCWIGLQYR